MNSRLETSDYEAHVEQRLEAWSAKANRLDDDSMYVAHDGGPSTQTLLLIARNTLDELKGAEQSEDRQRLKRELDHLMNMLGRLIAGNAAS